MVPNRAKRLIYILYMPVIPLHTVTCFFETCKKEQFSTFWKLAFSEIIYTQELRFRVPFARK